MNAKCEINLHNIKYLHFYMAMIIVMYHVGEPALSAISTFDKIMSNRLSDLFECLTNIAMAYYFMVSGFLLFKGLDLNSYCGKVKRRIKTLAIPYVVWNVIVFSLKVTVGKLQLKDITTIFDMRYYPPDGPLWYMYCIFLLAMLSPCFLPMIKNAIPLLLAASVICNFLLNECSLGAGYLVNLIHFFPMWLFGGILAKNEFKMIDAIIAEIIICFSTKNPASNHLLYLIQITIVMLCLTTKKSLEVKKIRIYNYSFLLYVIHGPLIEIGGKVVKYCFFKMSGYVFVATVLSKLFFLVACLVCCELIYRVLRYIGGSQKLVDLITCGRG